MAPDGGACLERNPALRTQTIPWALTSKEITGTAALAAVAAVFEILPLDLAFPLLPFLTFDPTGIPIAIAGILYGPLAAFVTAGIAGFTIAARGNLVGATFKTAAELSTAVPLAAALWGFRGRISRNPGGARFYLAFAGLVAIAARVAVMTWFNLVFLPLLVGLPEGAVLGLLVPIGIFNGVQGFINVFPAFLIVLGLPPDLKPAWIALSRG